MLTKFIYFFIFLFGATGLAHGNNNGFNKNNHSQKVLNTNDVKILFYKKCTFFGISSGLSIFFGRM